MTSTYTPPSASFTADWSLRLTVTRHEAAGLLGVSVDTVDRLRATHKIRSAKFNNTVRCNRADVIGLIADALAA